MAAIYEMTVEQLREKAQVAALARAMALTYGDSQAEAVHKRRYDMYTARIKMLEEAAKATDGEEKP